MLTPSEIHLHTLIENHAAPHGYAIVAFDYFEQDAYYKIRLDRFDKTHPVTLIIFPDQLLDSVKKGRLTPAIALQFNADIGVQDRTAGLTA
ncbi:MAG TPA: hypothetical protein VGF44_01875 [Terriglobales bacterium]|jgi:hypothetical protein